MSKDNLWLILGGSGQIGSSLQSLLQQTEIKYDAPSSKLLDIRDFESIKNYVLMARPRVVINCAGWTDVEKAEKNIMEANILNGYAVENLITICNHASITLVHISTDGVFSGSKRIPYLTDDLTDPINVYGKSKLIGEKAIESSGATRYYIFRTAWVYSKFGKNFVKSIINKHHSGENHIKVVNDQLGNPTFATDFAAHIIESIKLNIPFGTYHVVNSGVASWYELAVKTFSYLGYDSDIIKAVSSDDYPSLVRRPSYTSLDSFNWNNLGLPEIRSWESALKFSLPQIVDNL